MKSCTTWSDSDDARLRQLWKDLTLSGSDIGRLMGRSKNSVHGRAHRLALTGRVSPIIRIPGAVPHREQRAALRKARMMAAAPIASSLGPIGPARTCQYPMWGRGRPNHVFCDEPAAIRSYCLCHARVCFVSHPELGREEVVAG